MVNLTIALFARFRVNGDVFDILKLSGMGTMNIIIPILINKLPLMRIWTSDEGEYKRRNELREDKRVFC